MNIILVPGLWLNAASWDLVARELTKVGHNPVAMSLPGQGSVADDRSGVTAADHIAAVVATIIQAPRPVLLVGHSAGSGLAWAAAAQCPDRVVRVVMVGGFPIADGDVFASGFAAENGEVPLPEFGSFAAEDLRDLDEVALARFRAGAVPVPERAITDKVSLNDPQRYDIPVTVICPEFSVEQLRAWIADGESAVQELTKIRDLTLIDLPTGHWPQFTRPTDLAEILQIQAAR